jgi:3-oxoacyl-[acyl-carrier-protein] synthase III
MNLASPPPRARHPHARPEIYRAAASPSIRSCVRGVGAALPARAVPNSELTKLVDTSDHWIVQRTGIRQRYIAGEGETTSTLAAAAARAALARARFEPADIDLIIVATSTPDFTFPAVATQVQADLGVIEGAAFDLQAVCSGFVYAVATADNFLRCGAHKRALVIGAETFSRILDWSDRTTCVLFGDGAGAIVLEARDSDGGLDSPGVIASRLRADGRHRAKLYVDGGPSTTKTVGQLRMEGREVFRHAVGMVTDVVQGCLDDAGVTADEIDWFVPHQANRRIIDATADKLGIPHDKVIVTVDQHGNTSAASIPLALDAGVKDGRIRPGDLVMIEAMGGGFTWGAALIRW